MRRPLLTRANSASALMRKPNAQRLTRVGDGSIIVLFDKTPRPRAASDVVCPHFYELKWATGCPYNCAWCYLKGTLRFMPEKARPRVKDYGKIRDHVLRFFEQANGRRHLLNSGELADSLMHDRNGGPFSQFIVQLFAEQNQHKVLFVTKSDWVKRLLEFDGQRHAVVSFSLNAEPVARRWEKGAPSPSRRIEAATRLAEAGYSVRVRIDPMVPVVNWEKHYLALVDAIFARFRPERITLGSLRGLQSTINNAKDKSWVKFLSERSNWGKKISVDVRYRLYRTVIDHLAGKYDYDRVALCKETVDIWNRLGLDYRKIACNCIW